MPICVEKIILQFPIRKSIFQLVISPLHHHFNQRPLSYGERYRRQVGGFGWRRQQAQAGGGTQEWMHFVRRVEVHRERIDGLLDHDGFIEIDALVSQSRRDHAYASTIGDGVGAGHGTIRTTCFLFQSRFYSVWRINGNAC